MKFIIIILLIINLVAFAAFGVDKWKAGHNKWRIPEATLLGLAFFGGSIGALAGMYLFHHKTKHKKFTVLVPTFLILHICLLFYILVKLD